MYRRQLSPKRKAEAESHLRQKVIQGPLHQASFNVFTYHGEDGIILYLLHHIGAVSKLFLDIGSGDCIKSNCANLAVHYGWQGMFVDKDPKQLAVGQNFYRKNVHHNQLLKFLEIEVTTEKINGILKDYGYSGDVGLLSIDIDGNDYWIWKAIEVIRPSIVVIEAKVEFGELNIVVPYGTHNHHGMDKMYNGASVEALRLLGEQKGYKLAGANKQGYNLFFVKKEATIPVTTTREIINNPETIISIYPDKFFSTHTFVKG